MTRLLLLVLFSGAAAWAEGIYGNAGSARSSALGGTFSSSSDDPYSAMAQNPAGLTLLTGRIFSLNLATLFSRGNFTNAANSAGRLSPALGLVPYGAVGMPIKHSRFALGLALTPEALASATWHYSDTPGGWNNADYGMLRQKSAIVALRAAAGLGYAITPRISAGLTLGAVYNSNTLQTAYIFQSQPVLKGFKTLLDLNTTGVGWNATAGLLVRVNRAAEFGFTYKSPTVIESTGDAIGNASVQFAAVGVPFQPDFHYKAMVRNVLPQSATASYAWRIHPRLRLALQGDWINWSRAFRTLPVTLTEGNNADINGFTGSNRLRDDVPLRWRDQAIARVGFETPVGESIGFRGGYSFSSSAVPSATLTPLTASIAQNTISAGFGYTHARYAIEGAYGFSPTQTRRVGHSDLQSGEYGNSRVRVGLQSVTISTSARF